MVLHVAHPPEIDPPGFALHGVLELGEDLRVRLVQNVREHIQASAVGHAQHGVADALIGCAADDLVQHRDEHVEPFDGKPRLAGECAL